MTLLPAQVIQAQDVRVPGNIRDADLRAQGESARQTFNSTVSSVAGNLRGYSRWRTRFNVNRSTSQIRVTVQEDRWNWQEQVMFNETIPQARSRIQSAAQARDSQYRQLAEEQARRDKERADKAARAAEAAITGGRSSVSRRR